MKKIHTITLNPAIDRMLYLNEYKPEITNRLSNVVDGLGGKGTHVSINLAILGLENQAMGIVHGKNGEQIIQMLSKDLIDVKFQQKDNAESRMNYLVVEDSGKCTCLSSKGVPLDDLTIEDFIKYMAPFIGEGDYLVFSGDASNCPDPYIYNKIMKAFASKNVKVFMDASGATLCKCVEEKPFLIKPNLDELSQLCGHMLETEEDILDAMENLSGIGIEVIALSLGGEGSLIYAFGKRFRVKAPKVNVRNTIGCGDCFLSGLVYGLHQELPMEETLRLATAISAACAESELSVGFDRKRAEELKSQVQMKEL